MSNQNNGNGVFVGVFILSAIVAAMLLAASRALCLDARTTITVLLLSTIAIAAYCYSIMKLKKWDLNLPVRISFWSSLPVLAALLWLCWCPAFNYWSNHAEAAWTYGVDATASFPKWYARWYAEFGIPVIILTGYFIWLYKHREMDD